MSTPFPSPGADRGETPSEAVLLESIDDIHAAALDLNGRLKEFSDQAQDRAEVTIAEEVELAADTVASYLERAEALIDEADIPDYKKKALQRKFLNEGANISVLDNDNPLHLLEELTQSVDQLSTTDDYPHEVSNVIVKPATAAEQQVKNTESKVQSFESRLNGLNRGVGRLAARRSVRQITGYREEAEKEYEEALSERSKVFEETPARIRTLEDQIKSRITELIDKKTEKVLGTVETKRSQIEESSERTLNQLKEDVERETRQSNRPRNDTEAPFGEYRTAFGGIDFESLLRDVIGNTVGGTTPHEERGGRSEQWMKAHETALSPFVHELEQLREAVRNGNNEDAKRVERELRRKTHPDVNPDLEEEVAQVVNTAIDFISEEQAS